MPITSSSNEKIRDAVKLNQRKYREVLGKFLAEGPHLVELAVKSGLCEVIFATDASLSFEEVPVWTVTQEVMSKLSDVQSPQGIVAVCRMPKPKALPNKLLLLDGIQDPGNLGTLLRSALAFGFTGVIAENTVDFYSPKVLRATQGATFSLTLMDLPLVEFMTEHSEYTYYGTSLDGQDLDKVKPNAKKIALILGNEGSGIRKELLAKTLSNIRIDIQGIESLNVAIAGSILMYEWRK